MAIQTLLVTSLPSVQHAEKLPLYSYPISSMNVVSYHEEPSPQILHRPQRVNQSNYSTMKRCVDDRRRGGEAMIIAIKLTLTHANPGCSSVDMLSFLSHEDMKSTTRERNDVETPPGGHLKNRELKYLGRLPTQTEPSPWHDMKVMMVRFTLDPKLQGDPVTFDIKKDLTAWFEGFGSSHNIVAHEETNMIYDVGTGRNTLCAGGLFMIDVSNPAKSTSPGCVNNEDGYVHGDTVDVTDMSQVRPDLHNPIPWRAAYMHQGWLADEKMEYLPLDDELMKPTAPTAANQGTPHHLRRRPQ
ncbi:hypothetical protein PABG_02789 [Paracoccidioides brasiliensis Pb03]|nr:hypothetical protein PABG_02789 [Paracoccidioides brasiliensis Pb03]